MIRVVCFSIVLVLAQSPSGHAGGRRKASVTPTTAPEAAANGSSAALPIPPNPAAAAKVEPATPYYPPPGSLQPPLTAVEVCRALRSGLSGAEVAQDLRERGFTGGFSNDEAADARAAGVSAELVAALQAGRFTVSSAYAHRYFEQAAKSQQTREANAWKAEAYMQQQQSAREAERRYQAAIAAENGRAVAAKERNDRQRFENMKAQADWESRQRQNYNANSGWWYNGRYYPHRYWSGGQWVYY